MRAVIQRSRKASVTSEGVETGRIDAGLTVLLGVGKGDGPADVAYLVDKICHLRIFEDDGGKMNQSLLDRGGQMLVVSQFTLYGDVRHGRRPSFTEAAPPDVAEALYERFVDWCASRTSKWLQAGFRRKWSFPLKMMALSQSYSIVKKYFRRAIVWA